MNVKKELEKPIEQLSCPCCGNYTLGRQHHNRDQGYGLCAACVPYCNHGMSASEFESCYGIVGVHIAPIEVAS